MSEFRSQTVGSWNTGSPASSHAGSDGLANAFVLQTFIGKMGIIIVCICKAYI